MLPMAYRSRCDAPTIADIFVANATPGAATRSIAGWRTVSQIWRRNGGYEANLTIGGQDKSTAVGRDACGWLDWNFLSAPTSALLALDVKILRKINGHSAVVPTKARRWPAVKVSGESVIRARRFRDMLSARVTAGPHPPSRRGDFQCRNGGARSGPGIPWRYLDHGSFMGFLSKLLKRLVGATGIEPVTPTMST